MLAFPTLSFSELRDRLKMRAEQLDPTEDIDIGEAARYLMSLPDNQHTAESVDAWIQLARNFDYAGEPREALQAASQSVRLASALQEKSLLCVARGLQGVALANLGRFSEATVAQADSWSLARDLSDKKAEGIAIQNFGAHCCGMGQFDVAMSYFERARELAKEIGSTELEFASTSNLATCAVTVDEPGLALRALAQLKLRAPETRKEVLCAAAVAHTQAELHLLTGDVGAAKEQAQKAAHYAEIVCIEQLTRATEALLGVINVWSGAVEQGLSAVDRTLERAKLIDHSEIPDHLYVCVIAYEAAGQSDKALTYLHELVAWNKQSIEAEIVPLQYEGLDETIKFQTGPAADLVAKAHFLQTGVEARVQHLIETAINAEIASGHDLYRTFRVAKLARCLAAAIGFDEERIARISLGARLCNIGMMAIPARVLQKRRRLTAGEREVLHEHTRYGAELLRKSKLQVLTGASVIAEQHHERYDGTGYPLGRDGNAIHEEARVVSICDAFDAMTHSRPWRATPLPIQEALNELNDGAGSQFDPSYVNAFVDWVQHEYPKQREFDVFLAEGADELEYVRARARVEALLQKKNGLPR